MLAVCPVCPNPSERQLRLVPTCTARLHGHHDVGRLLYRRKPCSHIRDQSRLSNHLALNLSEESMTTYPALLLALRKRLLDAVHDAENRIERLECVTRGQSQQLTSL